MTSQRTPEKKLRIPPILTLLIAALTVLIAFAASAQQAESAKPPAAGTTFSPAVTYDSGGQAVADLNGDGQPDIVVSNWGDSSSTHGLVGVLLGTGDGTFQPVVTYDSGGAPGTGIVVAADVNGDGKLDILVTSCAARARTCGSAAGRVSVLLGNGDGTFQSAVSYSSGAPTAIALAVADLDGDGKPDLVLTNSSGENNGHGTVSVVLNNGNGTFRSAVLYDAGVQNPNPVAVADVNGDGVPDLLVTNHCDSCTGAGILSVLFGNGDGTFRPAVTYPAGNSASVTQTVNSGFSAHTKSAPSAGCDTTTTLINPPGSPELVSDFTFQAQLYASSYCQGVYYTSCQGTISFYDNNSLFGSATVGAHTCIATVDAVLPVGTNQVTATYSGWGPYYSSTSSAYTLVVLGDPTTTTLTSSLNPSIYWQKVTLTAVVTTTAGGLIGNPTGKVRFNSGPYGIGFATLVPSQTINETSVATLTTAVLNAGTLPLTAVYLGDAYNAGSSSAILNQVVQPTTSSARLTSSPNPSTQGDAVTFTALLNSPTTTPTGPVTFTTGNTVLGTIELKGGAAEFTTSTLPVGSANVTVTFYGDSDIAGSSASVTQIVEQ
jgi:hypothetical protein